MNKPSLIRLILTEVQDKLELVSERSTKTEADFKNKTIQVAALNKHCEELFELLAVWNALKTSKQVLGADMPLAEEAANFEDKIKPVLFEGLEAVAKLQKRDGLELRSTFPAYIREQLRRCTDEQA
jgi:hypothetical protein